MRAWGLGGELKAPLTPSLLRKDGTLLGDMFDEEGFVRGAQRKGFNFSGAKFLVVGAGGVGSAIAASMAAAGVARITLYDVASASAEKLGARLKKHYPKLEIVLGSKDSSGHDIVVNASPLGMEDNDPAPPWMFSGSIRRRSWVK